MPTFQADESEFHYLCDACGRDCAVLDMVRHRGIWVCCVCYRERTACGPSVAEEVARERKVYDGGPRVELR